MTEHASPSTQDSNSTDSWQPDILGGGYQQRTLALGPDPDGEGEAVATLVRHIPDTETGNAVLYVHGFTDYFFQRHLAVHMAGRGSRFYALDLRKCGRSLREGHTPHYVSDLALYHTELRRALDIVREEAGGKIVLMAHSTGGLVAALWLHQLNRTVGVANAGIHGLVLNSPWFDLHGPGYYRTVGTSVINALGRFRAKLEIPLGKSNAYGSSLHHSVSGEWDYDLDWKPLHGFPVRLGWLRAIRRGHAQLHRGLDIGVPSLLLRSRLTKFASEYGPAVDVVDAVLDVRQIQRWAGCLGDRTSIVPIDGARHDVFLSATEPRATAFRELDAWLDWLGQYQQYQWQRMNKSPHART